MHFAGYKAVGESMAQPMKYYRNNLGTTMSLLEAMAETGCRKLVFSSSATVYGGPYSDPITEDFARSHANTYGHTKLVIEDMLARCARLTLHGRWRYCATSTRSVRTRAD